MPMGNFPRAMEYVRTLDWHRADELDTIVKELVEDEINRNRVRKALDERFNKGAEYVPGIDRGGRLTRIKRSDDNGRKRYLIEGIHGDWHEPEERVWPMAMMELYRLKRKARAV